MIVLRGIGLGGALVTAGLGFGSILSPIIPGLVGGGSADGLQTLYKIPQWAVEQREERERVYEEERARNRAIVSAAAMTGVPVPEVRIPEGGIVTQLAYEGAEKLAKSLEQAYGIAGVPINLQDENESAIIALLLNEVYGIAGAPVKQQDENESAIIALLLSK